MHKKFEDIYSHPEGAPWTFREIPNEIKNVLKFLKKGNRVLEIGCGAGHQAIFLAKKGMKVKAIDSSINAINKAREEAKKNNINVEFKKGSFEKIKKEKEKYDFIFDWRFLHEITDEKKRDKYLNDVSNLLKPNGKYLSTSFSGDSNFMGRGKLRTSPVGIKIYFAKLKNLILDFKNHFKVLEFKHIIVPQKPDLKIKANYILAQKK
jgi:ubiquinone/menaquinone biosynthesis C-methylase UbiE